jgi:hypothetical protein
MWLLVCGGLTGLGLVASVAATRRRGAGAGLRGVAWSLLPMVAYLTGVAGLLWKLGTAVGHWALGFVFSPKVWAGIALAGLSALLFAVSRPLRRRAPARRRPTTPSGALEAPAERAEPLPSRPGKRKGKAARPGAAGLDDEFAEVEEILRRRGIT